MICRIISLLTVQRRILSHIFYLSQFHWWQRTGSQLFPLGFPFIKNNHFICHVKQHNYSVFFVIQCEWMCSFFFHLFCLFEHIFFFISFGIHHKMKMSLCILIVSQQCDVCDDGDDKIVWWALSLVYVECIPSWQKCARAKQKKQNSVAETDNNNDEKI